MDKVLFTKENIDVEQPPVFTGSVKPAWSAHESAVIYLSELYEKTKDAMKELQISTTDLEKAAKAAREAEDTSDFATFKALDDVFYKEMEKAYHLISEKI